MEKSVPILNIEEPQLAGNGEQRILMTSKVPLKNPDGQSLDIFGFYTYITEFRLSPQQNIDQQAKLMSAAKMSSLGEMAGGMAQEINNPLAIVHSLVSQVQEIVNDPNADRSEVKLVMNEIS